MHKLVTTWHYTYLIIIIIRDRFRILKIVGGGLMSSTKDARIEAPSGVWGRALPIRGGVVLKNFTSPTSVANCAQ